MKTVNLFTALVLVAGLALVVAPVPVAQAATIIVDSTADDTTAGDGQCTLREAINNANSDSDTTGGDCTAGDGDDVITLPAGTYTLSIAGTGEDANATGDLDITDEDALTINGAGAASTIVDADQIDRVFHVASDCIAHFNDLTIRNGNAPVGGGGIKTQYRSTVTLTNCTVSGNQAGSAGGGIYTLRDATVTLTNCTVSGNQTGAAGGGGIYNTDGTVNLTNSIVSGNQTPHPGRGGGIFSHGLSTVTLTNSTVSGNWSGYIGGGISNEGETGRSPTLNLTNSTVSGNQANSAGGISNWQGTVNLTNSTVSGNEAGSGGGIWSSYFSTLNLTNSTVSGNQASDRGGGIYHEVGTLTLTNSTISGNSAPDGGGIHTVSWSGTVTLTNTIVAAQASGPDCYWYLAPVSNGYNLDGDGTCGLTDPSDLPNTDPLLGALQDNGGPTETHALLDGSPAIDHIPPANCPVDTDQRGVARPKGAACDIGAYEFEPPTQPELWAVEYRWGDPPPGFSFAWPYFTGWMEVRIENRGDGDAFNVTATITDAPDNTTVPDPDVTVGDIPAGGSAWSTDTFTTTVDMSNPQDPCEGVTWSIEYDDEGGDPHETIVPEFPPGEGPCD